MPITKRITNYCNYAAWNCDDGERVATAKNAHSNRCDAIGNIYVSEGFAIPKAKISNRCDTIWNIYVS